EFVESLARIAVAQICDSVGLQGCQVSALNALSNVMCKYVQDLGKVSSLYANLAGRGESNVFDVVRGMEDLGVCHGFAGGSDLDCCVLESGIVKEVMRYVDVTEEV
nr:transcription initiation factor TFIID subunit 8-like [Tanacetum cinerariifolium]